MNKKKYPNNVNSLEILTEMVEAITPEVNQESFAIFFLHLIDKYFGFKKTILELLSTQNFELFIVATQGVTDKFKGLWSINQFGLQISKKILASGSELLIPDLTSYLGNVYFAEICKKECVNSLLSVNLTTRDSMIGTLSICAKSPREFTQKDVNSLLLIANYAATFINFICQRESIRERLERIKRFNRNLEELKSFHEMIIENIPIGVAGTNEKGYIILMNKEMERLSLCKKDSALGKRWFEVFHFEGEIKEKLETSYRTSSQQFFPEIYLPIQDGSFRLVEMKTDVIKDPSGDRKGVIVIASDIAEKKKMEREFEMVERLASIGKLTTGIAHEIRNPLAGISGTLQVLKNRFKGDTALVEIINRVFVEISRLDNVVEKLYGITSPKKLIFNPHSISDLIKDTLFILKKPLKNKKIRIIYKLRKDLQPIMIDKNGIQEVILNIVINAMNAMPKGGDLTIKTLPVENTEVLGPDILWHKSNSNLYSRPVLKKVEERYLTIIITDMGVGILDTVRPKIFEPFFSGFGSGTGLGLYLSAKIIEQHHGRIGVTSQKGKGSSFYILLPV